MTTYNDLLVEADNNHLTTKEKPLRAHKGRIMGNKIAIRKDLTETEKKCILAEELGHYYTTAGDILLQTETNNAKQELKARLVAYNKLIGLQGIIDCFNNRCTGLYEMAEHLGVTAEFLDEAIKAYRMKYGAGTTVDNYFIGFEPVLYVIEQY